MLDPKIVERARTIIHAAWPEEQRAFRDKLLEIISEMHKRGVLQSSMTLNAATQAAVNELHARANRNWGTLMRVHQLLGAPLTETLSSDLKHHAKIFIDEDAQTLRGDMMTSLGDWPTRLGVASGSDPYSLHNISTEVINKINAEIDLYVDAHSVRVKSIPQSGQQTVLNISGPVGAVQAGSASVAHITQNLAPKDTEELLRVLELLRGNLSIASDVDDSTKKEMLTLIDDSISELKKEHPVLARVRAYLSDVANTVQIFASAQPAYQALKAALVPLGIVLP